MNIVVFTPTGRIHDKWLLASYNWIKETDPHGHLQMPVTG